MFFAFLLLSLLISPARAAESSCALYRCTGQLVCSGDQMSVVIFPKSRAEKRIHLRNPPDAYKTFCRQTLSLTIRLHGSPWAGVAEPWADPLDSIPVHAVLTNTADDVQPLGPDPGCEK